MGQTAHYLNITHNQKIFRLHSLRLLSQYFHTDLILVFRINLSKNQFYKPVKGLSASPTRRGAGLGASSFLATGVASSTVTEMHENLYMIYNIRKIEGVFTYKPYALTRLS